MYVDFEYKLSNQRRGVWLAAAMIMLMLGVTLQTANPSLMWAIYVLAIVMLSWMMIGVPMAGIRVTDTELVASAWRAPVAIPLIDIAEMRAVDWTEESDVEITMLDGTAHVLRSGELPPISVLTDVMMERGVYLRDPS
jgi:hypothetical protein